MNSKRKYWSGHLPNKKTVDAGMSGLLFTFSGNEKTAVREAYSLIDMVTEMCALAEKSKEFEVCELKGEGTELPKAEQDIEESDDEDVSDLVKRYCDKGLFSSGFFRYMLPLECVLLNLLINLIFSF